jgi:hypothetical protein
MVMGDIYYYCSVFLEFCINKDGVSREVIIIWIIIEYDTPAQGVRDEERRSLAFRSDSNEVLLKLQRHSNAKITKIFLLVVRNVG